MADFFRYRVEYGNFGEGSPGVSIIHSTSGVAQDPTNDIGNFMNQLHNGFETVKTYLINGMIVGINAEVTRHDVATGRLLDVHQVTPPVTTVGTSGPSATSRATVAVCRHNTDAITDRGKRLVGRSYVGPVASAALTNSGGISAAAISAFGAMWDGVQDIAGNLRLIVWHRPLLAEDGDTVISPGSFGHVQGSYCLTKPGVLRSRRD